MFKKKLLKWLAIILGSDIFSLFIIKTSDVAFAIYFHFSFLINLLIMVLKVVMFILIALYSTNVRLEVFDFICSLSRNFIDFMSPSVIHRFFCLDLFN